MTRWVGVKLIRSCTDILVPKNEKGRAEFDPDAADFLVLIPSETDARTSRTY